MRRLDLIVAGLLVVVALVLAVLVFRLGPFAPESPEDQCSKPVSERQGGWLC